MNFILKPALMHITLVKIAATLWNQDDVKDLLAELCIPSYFKQLLSEWEKIEAIAVGKVAKFPIPNRMKEKIMCFIRPVGFQIAKWKEFHERGCNLDVDLPSEFHWTPQGTIDKKRTAELMIKDESTDITTRYKLACIYCLEDDIPKLWDKLPEDSRNSFYSQEDPMHVRQKELVVLWTYQIKGEVHKMDSMIEKRMKRKCSSHQYAFELAAIDGNRVATEYFLQKLTTAEREESLVKTAASVAQECYFNRNKYTGILRETFSDVHWFLLSQLDEEQQLEVFKSCPYQVLTCFLSWPRQSFFMEVANCMWSFLPKIIYQFVFIHITGNVIKGFKDFNYQKLFQEFWEQSPPDYKRHVLNDGIFCRIVSELLQIRDIDNVKLVFQDATPANKASVFYRDASEDTCKELVKNNQLNLLKYFIKECLPSENKVVEFKKYFENGDVWHVNENHLKKWQRKFLCILNEIICEFEEEKCAKGKTKKFKKK